jgi:hypothetical protein
MPDVPRFFAEQCDLGRELKAAGSTLAVAPAKSTTQGSAQPDASHWQPQRPEVPHGVLDSFAKRYDVQPGEIMGSQKRVSPGELVPDAPAASKRACASGAVQRSAVSAPATSGLGRGEKASDAVLAGMSSARGLKPAARSELSSLAEQLGPYTGGATQLDSQAVTQMLNFTQAAQHMSMLAPQQLNTTMGATARARMAPTGKGKALKVQF